VTWAACEPLNPSATQKRGGRRYHGDTLSEKRTRSSKQSLSLAVA
jgi:hypothetical protein